MFRTRRAVSIDKSKANIPNTEETNPPPPPADAPPDSDAKPDTTNTVTTATHEPSIPEDEEGESQEDTKEKDQEEVIESPPEVDTTTLAEISEEIDTFISNISSDTTNPPTDIPSSVDKFAKLAEQQIAKYDTGDLPAKLCNNSDEDSSLFFDSIRRISKLTTSLSNFPSQSECVTLVNMMSSVLQRAMILLEDEFKILLLDCPSFSDPDPPTDSKKDKHTNRTLDSAASGEHHDRCVLPQAEVQAEEETYPGYSQETIESLKKVVTAMVSAGYETECCQIYNAARRSAFEEKLSKLGFEKISMDDVQKMQWETLEREIVTWIDVTKRCTTIYFSGERKLCDKVFADYSTIADELFGNLTRNVANKLLIFAEAVGMTKRSAEKLFKFLDMYETLRDMNPKMDELFIDENAGQEIKSDTSSARCRLGEAAVGIFCDLENSIKSDTGKTPVPGGAVHPLTRYIMNYVKYACEYKDTLEQVFQDHRKLDRSDSSVDADSEANTPNHQNNNNRNATKLSPFSVQLVTVMDLLDSNLENKSRLYKDISLSYIFLMNNGRYIMQKIKGSLEIHDLMGDTWCRKRSSDLRQYHKNYQRETWSKVLDCLKDAGLNVNGKVSKPVLKERFKSFNAMFDEIHKAQSAWVVSDEQLQSELRVSISAVVIPAYRSFLGRFRQYLDAGRQTEKYIKFGPEDIETYIDELFDGNPQSMVRRRT